MKDIEVYSNIRSIDNVFEGEVVYHFTDDEFQRLTDAFIRIWKKIRKREIEVDKKLTMNLGAM